MRAKALSFSAASKPRGPESPRKKSAGTTAAIESRALIHTFDPERLLARTEEGRAVAAQAAQAGHDALAELQFRRRGLAVSLVLVGFVLVGLWLKIREVDRKRAAEL